MFHPVAVQRALSPVSNECPRSELMQHLIFIYLCLYVYVCMYVCMYVCVYVWMYGCVYVWMYVCVYVWMYICVYVHYSDWMVQ